MTVPQDWMPADMGPVVKDTYAALFPTDPHLAAAHAWDTWAQTLLSADGGTTLVSSVSTGSQSISYATPVSAHSAALDVMHWHLARSRKGAVLSPDFPDQRLTGACPPPDGGPSRRRTQWRGF